MKKPDKCPHCGETGIDYRNYKRHLYMYCVDPLLINETEEEMKKKYLLSIRNGEHKQFVWDEDKEKAAKGEKVIGDGVRALVGEEAAEKMDESLSFTEPGIRLPDLDNDRDAIDAWDDIKDDKPILKSEEDAKLFFESIDNPKPPNDKLKEAAKKYKGETSFKDPVKSEPTENPGFIRRILNWFKK